MKEEEQAEVVSPLRVSTFLAVSVAKKPTSELLCTGSGEGAERRRIREAVPKVRSRKQKQQQQQESQRRD